MKRMNVKRILSVAFVAVALLAIPHVASAQATGTSKLAWDQPSVPDAATAQAFTYKYYADGATTGVTCTGTAPVTCQVNYPAFTPGSHTLTLTASNVAGESPKSAVFSFTFVVIPAAPNNIRIQ